MSEILKTIREWIEIQGKELLAAADAHNREDERVEAGKYNMLKAVENLIETSSPWRNFRKEQPADQVRCWIIYADCLGQSEESEMAWFYVQHDYWRDSTGERVYIKDIKWLFWMPYQAPAPPTAAEIEAAMKGEE